MKKLCVIVLLVVTLTFVGCSNSKGQTFGEFLQGEYPYVKYQNSTWRFDANNMEIKITDGYTLDQGNAYEWVETEDGYDLVMHFKKGGEG